MSVPDELSSVLSSPAASGPGRGLTRQREFRQAEIDKYSIIQHVYIV